jgi:hypothetical protein
MARETLQTAQAMRQQTRRNITIVVIVALLVLFWRLQTPREHTKKQPSFFKDRDVRSMSQGGYVNHVEHST